MIFFEVKYLNFMNFLVDFIIKNIITMKFILVIIFQLLLSNVNTSVKSLPKVVWTFWSKDISTLPSFQYRCLISFQNTLKQDGWQIIILNNENYINYLDGDDMKNFQKLSSNYIFSKNKQLLLDLVKVSILKYKGGIWIDLNVILLQNFNWIYELQNYYKQHQRNTESFQIFMFHTSSNSNIETSIVDINLIDNMKFHPWFIAALPNSRVLKDWFQSWINQNSQSLMEYLQMSQQQLFNLKLKSCLNNIFKNDQNSQNSNNHQKNQIIWTIQTSKGPFMLQESQDQYLRLSTLDDLKRQRLQPKYLIKVSNLNAFSKFKDLFVEKETSTKDQKKDESQRSNFNIIQYLVTGQFYTNEISCYNPNLVIKDSILYKYLAFGDMTAIKIVQDKQQYKKSCKQVELVQGVYFFNSFMFCMISILGLFFGLQWVLGKLSN